MRSIGRWPRAGASVATLGLLAAVANGCGSARPLGGTDGGIERVPEEPRPVDAVVSPDEDAQVVDASGAACSVVVESHPDEGAYHIACTSPAVYNTDPPSSGNHYPIWAAYQTYTSPVPWGNLVHCLEHGAMVIVYNCPAGCPDEVARAQAWIDALAPDPVCGSQRVVLAPDPTLGVRWAASAWTWTLRSDCFDEEAFSQFYADHYGRCCETFVCGGGASTPDTLCPPP